MTRTEVEEEEQATDLRRRRGEKEGGVLKGQGGEEGEGSCELQGDSGCTCEEKEGCRVGQREL